MSFEEKLFGPQYPKNRLTIKNENDSNMGGGSSDHQRRPEQTEQETRLCVGYDTILKQLDLPEKIPEECINRLKSLPDCDNIVGKLACYLREEQWRMLLVLEAYDKRTFDHSLRVATFVYDLTHEGGATETYMIEKIKEEKNTLEDLFTAALFHDIGKTAIPSAVLHDKHSRREWAKKANTHANYFDQRMLEESDDIELDTYFMQIHANGTDPLNIIPLREIFDEKTLAELQQHGISPDDTLRKVLECHEVATRAILRRQKMYEAADIASRHHDYNHRPIRLERYPTAESALRLGFILSLLRSIDVYDALTSNDRSYKKSYHPLLALEILIKEAEADFTELTLTKYVVRDLYKKLESSQKNVSEDNIREKKALDTIIAFIQ